MKIVLKILLFTIFIQRQNALNEQISIISFNMNGLFMDNSFYEKPVNKGDMDNQIGTNQPNEFNSYESVELMV